MGKKYDRLGLNERIEIEKLLSHKLSYAEIGRKLGRSKSTIQREVAKQGRKKYKASKGEHIYISNYSQKRWNRSKIKLNLKPFPFSNKNGQPISGQDI
jgi:IS30 family transposase